MTINNKDKVKETKKSKPQQAMTLVELNKHAKKVSRGINDSDKKAAIKFMANLK